MSLTSNITNKIPVETERHCLHNMTILVKYFNSVAGKNKGEEPLTCNEPAQQGQTANDLLSTALISFKSS